MTLARMHHRMGTSRRGTLSSCLRKIISRLNHFNFRLRPTGLRPSCLTFGVTSACPMFAIWWLTYLARTGIPPAGIIDLARPHTPSIFMGLFIVRLTGCMLGIHVVFAVLARAIVQLTKFPNRSLCAL